MNVNKENILSWIDEHKDEFFQVSDTLWEHPELSMEEYDASDLLTEFLAKKGFTVDRGIANMPTAFAAKAGAGKPVIGFSCEYDALPGVSQDRSCGTKKSIIENGPGHGCGHNLMAIGGAMAATALKEWMAANSIPGTIKIFGTPAEELCMGKAFLAREGYFDSLDLVLDWHPWSFNMPGFNQSNAYFNTKYTFKGKSAHGNAPWFGRSSLDAAILMSNALEFLREHLPPGRPDGETTLNYTIANNGPSVPNVVPDDTTLWCVGRMTTAEHIADLSQRVDQCAEGIAMATDTKVEREVITITHEKLPNKTISELLYKNLQLVGPPKFTEEEIAAGLRIQRDMGVKEEPMGKPVLDVSLRSMPTNDTTEYSWHAPTEILLVEMAPSGIGWHNWIVTKYAGSAEGKKAVLTAAKTLACTALDMLMEPKRLRQARTELQNRLAGRVYRPLFGDEVMPNVTINRKAMDPFRE